MKIKNPISLKNPAKIQIKTIQEEIAKIFKLKKLTLSAVESCTGGLISKMITEVPGSSSYFKGGLTAYSNEVKVNVLGIKKKTLTSFGAVSPQCAFEMAERAIKIFKTDFAVSTTGIAGPGGASAKKPIGMVYFGLAHNGKTKTYKKIFKGNRNRIQKEAAHFALNLLIKNIK
ncbi:MAG: CinA family protein [Elusimicrobiota bacterium]|nr:CinA family protein [Elusimicrobiota bacterium]